jgi:GNAT superfamily N-acetyltransferase
LAWAGTVEKCPLVLQTIETPRGPIDFRQTGERLRYCRIDDAGEIVRNFNGDPLYWTDLELLQRNAALFDQSIIAFDGDRAIGLVSNEWGVPGVWVEREYQRNGIGLALLTAYHRARPIKSLGQATWPGRCLARAFLRAEFGVEVEQ